MCTNLHCAKNTFRNVRTQTKVQLNRAFRVIQGHPYNNSCRQKVVVINVKQCQRYFRNLRTYSKGKCKFVDFNNQTPVRRQFSEKNISISKSNILYVARN